MRREQNRRKEMRYNEKGIKGKRDTVKILSREKVI